MQPSVRAGLDRRAPGREETKVARAGTIEVDIGVVRRPMEVLHQAVILLLRVLT